MHDKVIKSETEDLLKLLDLSGQVTVSHDESGLYRVDIETPESGLLIGYHGEGLSGFQIILGLIVHKKVGEWVKITVEVGDYRAKQEEQLTASAASYAARVISDGQPLYLSNLSANERRIVHTALQNHPRVETLSEGEGDRRQLVIRLKTS